MRVRAALQITAHEAAFLHADVESGGAGVFDRRLPVFLDQGMAAFFLRCAPDRLHLAKPNIFQHNREASVATHRWCSGSSRNAVRLPFGTGVQLRRNPHPNSDSPRATAIHIAIHNNVAYDVLPMTCSAVR